MSLTKKLIKSVMETEKAEKLPPRINNRTTKKDKVIRDPASGLGDKNDKHPKTEEPSFRKEKRDMEGPKSKPLKMKVYEGYENHPIAKMLNMTIRGGHLFATSVDKRKGVSVPWSRAMERVVKNFLADIDSNVDVEKASMIMFRGLHQFPGARSVKPMTGISESETKPNGEMKTPSVEKSEPAKKAPSKNSINDEPKIKANDTKLKSEKKHKDSMDVPSYSVYADSGCTINPFKHLSYGGNDKYLKQMVESLKDFKESMGFEFDVALNENSWDYALEARKVIRQNLRRIAEGYISAILMSTKSNDGEYLADLGYDYKILTKEAMEQVKKDIIAFSTQNAVYIYALMKDHKTKPEIIGVDFFTTRQKGLPSGPGPSSDRNIAQDDKKLIAKSANPKSSEESGRAYMSLVKRVRLSAEKFGAMEPFVGDDNRLHLSEQVSESKKKGSKGLWHNIHAKRKRGEPPAKPGEKGYPKTLDIEETYEGDGFYENYGEMWYNTDRIDEAEYQGRKVKLGKPMRGDVKKFKVYVKNPKGNVVKVNFGDPDMKIKKSDPKARKSFRARHNCDNPGPRHKARYWSCRKW